MVKDLKDIDFVILWVDPSDTEWQAKKERFYSGDGEATAARYRDWDNLKYWFRAVEKYAPWVRTIHFVSDNQVPEWLNVSHPKIHIVSHSDYIPADCLPLFNSGAIEIGIHLIPGLAERFVFFNDDMFLTSAIDKDYYYNGFTPCDTPALTRKKIVPNDNLFLNICWNNYTVVNKYFNKNKVVFSHFSKFFNHKYGVKINLKNALNLCHFNSGFDGIEDLHTSIPYLKSEWEEVWEYEKESLSQTRKSRFRNKEDLSNWLIRYWRICKGAFFPKKHSGKYFGINNKTNVELICDAIIQRKYKEICINDEWTADGYEVARDKINTAFSLVFPDKSGFEL